MKGCLTAHAGALTIFVMAAIYPWLTGSRGIDYTYFICAAALIWPALLLLMRRMILRGE